MAEKLTVDIELAGGKEVQDAFKDIGASAKEAFDIIAKAAKEVGGFENLKFDDVKDKLKAIGVEGEKAFNALKQSAQDAGRMETLLNAVDKLAEQLGELGEEGRKAFQIIDRAAADVGGFEKLDPETVVEKLKELGIEGKEAFDKIKEAVKTVDLIDKIRSESTAVAQQFDQLATAGQQAFAKISQAASDVNLGGINTDQASQKLQNLGNTGAEAFDKIATSAQRFGQVQLDKPAAELGETGQAAEQSRGAFEALTDTVQAGAIAYGAYRGGIGGITTAISNLHPALKIAAGAVVTFTAALELSAGHIRAVNEQAMKLGLTVEVFDGLRQAMERAGIKTNLLAEALGKLKEQGAKAALEDVNAEIAKITDTKATGYVPTVNALANLTEAAKGVGPAAQRAREFLDGLTGTFPGSAAAANKFSKTIDDITKSSDSLPDKFADIVDALAEMPDSTERTALAMRALGTELGTKIINGLQTGAIEFGHFSEEMEEATRITAEQARQANQLEQAHNRLNAGLARLNSMTFAPVWIKVLEGTVWVVENIAGGLAKLSRDIKSLELGASFDLLLDKMPLLRDAFKYVAAGFGWVVQNVKEGAAKLWQDISAALSATPGDVWAWVATTFDQAVQAVYAGAGQLKQQLVAAISAAPGQIWAWVATTFDQTVQAVYARAGQLKQQLVAAISAAPGDVWAWITQTFDSAVQTVTAAAQSAWQSVASAISQAPGDVWAWISQTFDSAVGSLEASAQQAWQTVVDTLAAAPGNVWQWVVDSFYAIIDSLVQAAIAASSRVARALGFSGGGEVGASGMARGGMVGGRGSGTSDSNLAWVSRGEHIMPARAVRQPGVLAFLEALRRSGGNLARVLDGMNRFALGGLVPARIPAFADGGLAGGGMSNVTIQFPGLPAIGGLRASSEVVDELRKAAALAQVRSGGRKPSRYS